MRDFPVFATENGVGSLILKEIPYRHSAYIRIESAAEPSEFLKECMDFCRMAGARYLYATGHEILDPYPEYTTIWRYTAAKASLPDPGVSLFPVTEQTADRWQELYNQKMRNVPCSAYMTRKDMAQILVQFQNLIFSENHHPQIIYKFKHSLFGIPFFQYIVPISKGRISHRVCYVEFTQFLMKQWCQDTKI